ncbi:MBL fold metallo-hydrolase [Paenibacillus thiaminolyticus]|uniref:MBL fold metallo-hydrolase n=1 Tax=Paenibacillus thiaminolyticus TaxID=49283 RepID=UPI00232FDF15|nr:MBL fold metallo-hydrolase [Paenibacillus thiaminolyticus]WCF09677.1 MBL fold metallo-hydrolase [Paenibacillus thiaminolyticus]
MNDNDIRYPQEEGAHPVQLHRPADGVLQARIPLPYSLRWVNSYLLKGPEGYTIVDPGLGTEEVEACWTALLSELDGPVVRIVLTHYHPDHLGMAGRLQRQLDIPVLISETGWDHALRLWGPGQRMSEAMMALFAEHGVPAAIVASTEAHMDGFLPLVSPLPAVEILGDGEQTAFGGRIWDVVETAGHAPGHLSFYHAASGLMLAGDHVLPQISPNVSYMPGSDPQPLQSYLEGLARLRSCQVELALPGHRHPFRHYAARIDELLRHHEERLAAIAALLAEEARTAYDVCVRCFGSPERLTIHQFRFAMGEALAHLLELERRGEVRRTPPSASVPVRFHSC